MSFWAFSQANSVNEHIDNRSVDDLSQALRFRLKKGREQGQLRFNSSNYTDQRLSDMLREFEAVGDVLGVASVCAAILARGSPILPPVHADRKDAARYRWLAEYSCITDVDRVASKDVRLIITGYGDVLHKHEIDAAIDDQRGVTSEALLAYKGDLYA